MPFSTEHIYGTLTALAPVHHGGDEKTGNTNVVMRNYYLINGQKMPLPVISGNSIRGTLRRLIMADMLERLGYCIGNLKFYNTLFSGGKMDDLDPKNSGYLDLEMKLKVRSTIIPLSILGFSMHNQMPEGKIKCGIAHLKCRERTTNADDPSVYDLIDFTFTTRRDDLRAEREDGEQPTQMKIDWEYLVPGTVFEHKFILVDMSDIERACFGQMIKLWGERPYIGGKSSIGFGEVKIEYPNIPAPDAYLKFLETNRAEIICQMQDMEQALK